MLLAVIILSWKLVTITALFQVVLGIDEPIIEKGKNSTTACFSLAGLTRYYTIRVYIGPYTVGLYVPTRIPSGIPYAYGYCIFIVPYARDLGMKEGRHSVQYMVYWEHL